MDAANASATLAAAGLKRSGEGLASTGAAVINFTLSGLK
jgi:hypothetical protein